MLKIKKSFSKKCFDFFFAFLTPLQSKIETFEMTSIFAFVVKIPSSKPVCCQRTCQPDSDIGPIPQWESAQYWSDIVSHLEYLVFIGKPRCNPETLLDQCWHYAGLKLSRSEADKKSSGLLILATHYEIQWLADIGPPLCLLATHYPTQYPRMGQSVSTVRT